MKTFVIVPDGSVRDWKEITGFLFDLDGTEALSAFLGRFVLLKSKRETGFVVDSLAARFPEMRFLVSPVEGSRLGGVMPDSFWTFAGTQASERLAS